jgi:ribonuclease Z
MGCGETFLPKGIGLWTLGRLFTAVRLVNVCYISVSHLPIARCLGYVFRERSFSSVRSDVYIPYLDRNAEALREQNIRHPYSLIKTLVNDRQELKLPDGTILQPPPLDIPGRKVVVLGDTCEPSAMVPIAMDASILVHEATNAYMSKEITKNIRGLGSSGTPESVRYKAIGRGHSTADMAGEFAKSIRARRLVLNHFSTK